MSDPRCPDCGSTHLHRLGALPDVPFFAGQRLERPLPGGDLLHCADCDLRFRDPHLGVDTYDRLYDNARVDAWTGTASLRRDQRLVQAVVQQAVQAGARSVLDFGCYSGEFLAALPHTLQKFGVEVNATAAAMAAQRAGARVERGLDRFDAAQRFDVIVSMDVIEHVPSPRALLAQWLARLAPGGTLIVTTGDGANALWRLVGARWWYCYFPEHIAFVSERWLRHHAAALGAAVREVRRFEYLDRDQMPGFVRRWKPMLRYLLAPSAYARRQQRHFDQHGTDLGVPGIGLTRDHLLLVIGRNA